MPARKLTTVTESARQTDLHVDRESGIVRDVKILGWDSRNEGGRRYDPKGCSTAESLACYDGKLVNIDHAIRADGHSISPAVTVPFAARFGRIVGPYAKDDGIYARELRCNKAHPAYESFAWWAENDPAAIGLSHVARCYVSPQSDKLFEGIGEVTSVDIVANPATTKGLFESTMDSDPVMSDAAPAADSDAQLGAYISSVVADSSLDIAAKRKKILGALKLLEDGGSEPADPPADPPKDDAMESLRNELTKLRTDNTRLVAEVDTFRLKDDTAKRRTAARAACAAAKLPERAVTEVFLDTLVNADDAGMKRLIEDRRAAATPDNKPLSAGQSSGAFTLDDFLKAVSE